MGMVATKSMVRRAFPDVSQLSVKQLRDHMEETAPIILLDVRDRKEFEVSHLRGAIHTTPGDAAEAATALANAGYQKGTRVVLYCSVGYRSSNLANELVKQGLVDAADAFNLEGSIFEWANLGNEVVRGDEPATLVHPFNAKWGKLLSKDLRAPQT